MNVFHGEQQMRMGSPTVSPLRPQLQQQQQQLGGAQPRPQRSLDEHATSNASSGPLSSHFGSSAIRFKPHDSAFKDER